MSQEFIEEWTALDTWLVDDSRQRQPSRSGMTDLFAVGGLKVLENQIQPFHQTIDALCERFGFPAKEEFKWSPGKELWMRTNLTDKVRHSFFTSVFDAALAHQVKGIFVLADSEAASATGAQKAEHDVVTMLLERIQQDTGHASKAQVVADAPGGGAAQADEFITRNLAIIRDGTNALPQLNKLTFVQTARSHHSRGLQVADVFTSCLCAYVGGEDMWSPPVIPFIQPILRRESGRVGGCGVKLHPDYKYRNLYGWLFGDTHFWKGNNGHPLPLPGSPYRSGDRAFS